MARQFSYPTVAALTIGGHTHVSGSASAVKRKVALYGGRKGKRFTVTNDGQFPGFVRVTREADPVDETADAA